ncbi:lipase/acyltransferase domain-containing protein [Streptomyces niveus]|uniref:lipase/acyltransferase domain-containing protein n=1 Tax=Streptomyces niveus TaxID=193462 RepID=UPI0035DAC828
MKLSSAKAVAVADITQDAVVIVPGIMGSELYDTVTGKTVWGLSGVSWLLKAWTRPGGLDALRLTPDELEGKTGRIKATQLMRHSSWTPYLQGFEPYTNLISTVHDCVADPAAVLEFAYDWRLPVGVNARALAVAAHRHLTAWREHPAHDDARRLRVDERPARLVFVAHSMGGLVTRAALDPAHDSQLADDTRAVLTLGTPFYGAVKATAILNTGRGAPVPLPHRQLRSISATMPGLHDLLPQYACLIDGSEMRGLTPGDVAAIGGSAELAQATADFYRGLDQVILPGHRAVAGTNQATLQSLSIRDGVVSAHQHGARQHSNGEYIRDRHGALRFYDVKGDGTVHKESAAVGAAVTPLPLQHGAVAADSVALRAVAEMLRDDEHLGPPQGAPGCGLDVPDLVKAGTPWAITLSGVESLAGLKCEITDTGGRALTPPRLGWGDGHIRARTTVTEPGLYRVTVRTMDGYRVSQLVLAVERDSGREDD